jgi:hypothetical protein
VREAFLHSRGGEKLVGVRPTFMANCNRLSTPDQLAAAAAEALPASNSILRRSPFGSRVPTLHGLNRDPVADFEWTLLQRPTQWRLRSCHNLGIAGDLQVESLQVSLKASNVF